MSTNTYLTAEQIELSIANTPQVVFETTDACNLACKYSRNYVCNGLFLV